MSYSVFNQTPNDAIKEQMFLGQTVNVSRYDQQKYEVFEKLIERQLSFFWRPEEIDVSKDRIDFQKLAPHEQHIFTSNLKYQTLLDSIQGRSPNVALLTLASIPELETWIESWAFSETIHSRSYTHIIRNIYPNPSEVLDDIVTNEEILKRATDVSKYYDDLIEYSQYYHLFGYGTHQINGKEITINKKELMKKIYLCLMSVNILEAIRFYVSFACSFAFAENEIMEGNAKIIALVARDEMLHLNGTQYMLRLLSSGLEGQEWKEVADECMLECFEMFYAAAEQEKEWARYLFKDGSILGLNEKILCDYVEHITDIRLMGVGLPVMFENKPNPIPWIDSHLKSDQVQVAPQETEIRSYLVGQVDATISQEEFEDFEL